MTTEAFENFKRSMTIDFIKWHDGEGYALDELGRMTPDELEAAERIVLNRQAADWRDVEALDAIGSQHALAAMQDALQSEKLWVRLEAATRLYARNLIAGSAMEQIIIRSLDQATIPNGLTKVLGLAREHASPAIVRKLLSRALNGNDDLRTHAAALAHFLSGKSKSEFDWDHRPLYLRFKAPSVRERWPAYIELCNDAGIQPEENPLSGPGNPDLDR